MPNRIIREGWLESEPINSLDPHAECFFLRLCLRADDFGRYHANTLLLKSALFPLRESVRTTDIPRWLAACEKAGLLRCYSDSEGKKYVEISKFGQRTRAEKSKFPEPQANDGQMTVSCLTDDRQPRTETETYSETNAETVKPKRAAVAAPASDADWLADLGRNPAYAGINIGAEYGKMQAWCGANRKTPSRRRFVNWLNRAERPMRSQIVIPAQSMRQSEPSGWRAALKELYPESTEDLTWATLPDSVRQRVSERLGQK